MFKRSFAATLLYVLSLGLQQCAPSLRRAKIDSGLSLDGAVLGTYANAKATDATGTDVTEATEFGDELFWDFKLRYGWERKKNIGFELSGGADGQVGVYVELPGTEKFHWGIGGETNLWLWTIPLDGTGDDEVADFLREYNYNFYAMAGLFPRKSFEVSCGIKYQPFLHKLLDAATAEEIEIRAFLPVTFLFDGRVMFNQRVGLMLGAEIFLLRAKDQVQQVNVSLNGGYLYGGLTIR